MKSTVHPSFGALFLGLLLACNHQPAAGPAALSFLLQAPATGFQLQLNFTDNGIQSLSAEERQRIYRFFITNFPDRPFQEVSKIEALLLKQSGNKGFKVSLLLYGLAAGGDPVPLAIEFDSATALETNGKPVINTRMGTKHSCRPDDCLQCGLMQVDLPGGDHIIGCTRLAEPAAMAACADPAKNCDHRISITVAEAY